MIRNPPWDKHKFLLLHSFDAYQPSFLQLLYVKPPDPRRKPSARWKYASVVLQMHLIFGSLVGLLPTAIQTVAE